MLETIKPAESREGYILRFYEPHNMSGKVNVKCGLNIKKAYETDLLESAVNSGKEIEVSDNLLSFDIKPFEIVTVKILTK